MHAIPPEIIRLKRDGHTLATAQIDAFVDGLVTGGWSDAQAAALAMAVVLRGMDPAETVALTQAMTRSGDVLRWDDLGDHPPIVDKHSTGGVGDKVSLMLAPIVAACGGWVPMVSGRGLGHTGGTLDKLESLPGYRTQLARDELIATLRSAGCAIVGASGSVAPADRRLYAIRDVTATVESTALITASILSKKLAAGLQALVMDVKTGDGAFASTPEHARELALSLVRVAEGAGLPTRAVITDMNQVLGHTAGNALEVQEALDYLRGTRRDVRLHTLTRTLCAELLVLGGLTGDTADAEARVDRALHSGEALERFERMVHAQGGPADVGTRGRLPRAPVQRVVPALHAGWVQSMAVRELGVLVVTLGGGRRTAGDTIDPRVGLSEVCQLGDRREAGEPLAMVHADNEAAADEAVAQVQRLITLGEAPLPQRPVVFEVLHRGSVPE
ncbi:thymidine phosphorylase [uncultured Sphaerotilus sp.]|uniref:thymidine phosphorylase n=1 Tax=uncultured Sphaerotilus sp. TaxID=474984 RepID=UPI0030CA45C9